MRKVYIRNNENRDFVNRGGFVRRLMSIFFTSTSDDGKVKNVSDIGEGRHNATLYKIYYRYSSFQL